MGGPIRTYRELLDRIAALPPPKSGYKRIFRGQTRDYPKLIPTGIRTKAHERDASWPLYSTLLAHDIASKMRSKALDDDLSMQLSWVRAIKQHYGPGTDLMDVTHSVGVAAWFALHVSTLEKVLAGYGPPGPPDASRDVVALHEYVHYKPHTEGPGYIYAFDVKESDSGIAHSHGELVDLAKTPEPFSSSPRIRIQQACLLYADDKVNGGDLRPFVVQGTPLMVAWPLEGCAEAAWRTEEIFPGVAQDDWYARFVALPLVPALRDLTLPAQFEHPMRITLYAPDASSRDWDDLQRRIVSIEPAFVFGELSKQINGDQTRSSDPYWGQLVHATAILLEGPHLAASHDLESGMWNEGLLNCDILRHTPAFLASTRQPGPQASLDNVFIEFSPLENTGWERIEKQSGRLVVRGTWLLREQESWRVALVCQEMPRGKVSVLSSRIVYNARSSRFDLCDPDEAPTPLRGNALYARPVLKALSLLRDLSPCWKVPATPTMARDIGTANAAYLLGIYHGVAFLVKLTAKTPEFERYHVARRLADQSVHFGGAHMADLHDLVTIPSQRPFGELDPKVLRRAASAKIAALDAKFTKGLRKWPKFAWALVLRVLATLPRS